MTYTLYGTPGMASMAPQAALEEMAVDYELRNVDLNAETPDPEYLKLNPEGKVPTLVVDGKHAIFEASAITMFLVDRHPESGLAPAPDSIDRGYYNQWFALLGGALQEAFIRYYYSRRFAIDEKCAAGIKERAREDICSIWARLDRHLESRTYLLGDKFSACDLYLLMQSTWKEPTPDFNTRYPNVARWIAKIKGRSAVKRTLEKNGRAMEE